MAIDFVPLRDRILVRRIDGEETTRGGLIIPDSAKEKPQEGEVLAVGRGLRKEDKVIPPDVKPGDRVLFGKHAGTDIVLDGGPYLILREEEVLGLLAKAAKKTKAV